MKLGELGEFLSTTLEFSIDGRDYSVPPIDWAEYLDLVKVIAHSMKVAGGEADDGDAPEDKPLYEMAPVILGPVFEQLQTDGVHPAKISIIARAAYLWQIGRPDDEVAFVLTGKAPAPATTSPTPTGSTGTDAVSTTKPRASTSGTRSRQKSLKPNAQPQESTSV